MFNHTLLLNFFTNKATSVIATVICKSSFRNYETIAVVITWHIWPSIWNIDYLSIKEVPISCSQIFDSSNELFLFVYENIKSNL